MTAKDYKGKDITISYDAKLCIHAAECVRGAPQVFDTTQKPWIQPDNGDADHVAQVVHRCPTGALTLRFADGRNAETAPLQNTASIAKDGPLYLRGRVVYNGGEHASMVEYTRVALCRCGASNNKPFCDGSHSKAKFCDSGDCAQPKKPLPNTGTNPDGLVKLNPQPDGPLMVEGRVEFKAADGSTFIAEEKSWLCRCGASKTKPFCDGSHKTIGFKA